MEGTKMICPRCRAYLIIYDGQERWPGGKEKEEVFCPKCHKLISTVMTSAFPAVKEISEEEYFAD